MGARSEPHDHTRDWHLAFRKADLGGAGAIDLNALVHYLVSNHLVGVLRASRDLLLGRSKPLAGAPASSSQAEELGARGATGDHEHWNAHSQQNARSALKTAQDADMLRDREYMERLVA